MSLISSFPRLFPQRSSLTVGSLSHFLPSRLLKVLMIPCALMALSTPAFAQYHHYHGGYGGRYYGYHHGYYHHGYYRHYHGGWRGPAVAAGVIGGLALGAMAANSYYHPYYSHRVIYAYPPPPPPYGCNIVQERYWNGWTYSWRYIEICP